MQRAVHRLHCSTQALGCWRWISLSLLPLSFLIFSFSFWVLFLTLIVTLIHLSTSSLSLSFPFFSSFYEEAILRKVKTILPACGAFTSCWDQLRIFHALYLLLYSWRAPAAKLLILPSVNLLPTSALVFSFSLRARSVALLIAFTCIHLPKVLPLLFPRTVLSPCNAFPSHCDNLRRRRGIHASLLKWSPPPSNLLRLAYSLPAFSLFFNFTLSIRLSFINIFVTSRTTGDSPAAKLQMLSLSQPLWVSVLNLSSLPLYTFLIVLSFPFYPMTILPACYVFTSDWVQLRISCAVHMFHYRKGTLRRRSGWCSPSLNLLTHSTLLSSLFLPVSLLTLFVTFTNLHILKVPPFHFRQGQFRLLVMC